MSNIISEDGLSFDDVLLVPEYSAVLPDQVETGTRLTKEIDLNISCFPYASDRLSTLRTCITSRSFEVCNAL